MAGDVPPDRSRRIKSPGKPARRVAPTRSAGRGVRLAPRVLTAWPKALTDASATPSASRFFAPAVGIAEDPVTGSAHCTLIPYWSRRLGKSEMFARRVAARGGEIFCEDHGPRVRADVVKAAPHAW